MLRDLPPRPRPVISPTYPRLAAALLALGLSGCSDNDAATTGSPPYPIQEDGNQCELDSHCKSGSCISEDAHKFAGGFVAQGICSTPCTGFLQGKVAVSPCDPEFACIADNPNTAVAQGWCLPRCTPGEAHECARRSGWACVPQKDGGVCMPACSIGSGDCSPGVCSPESGVCLPAGTTFPGDPIGSPCDLSATPDSCAGLCLPDPDDASKGECTSLCPFGSGVGICGGQGTYCSAADHLSSGDLGYCRPM